VSAESGISVVITTYNRQAVVRKILECLDRQTLPADQFEVIVADDESPDSTPEMVEEMASRVGYPLRHMRHKNQGPGATQNAGLRAADFDIVLLIADDIMPAPQMLAEHLKTHRDFPGEEFAVLGKAAQSPELPQTVIHKVWDPFQYHRFEGRREVEGFHFMGCNISVKKTFLLTHGLYRERRGIAHEDIELGYRLWQKGLRIIYNPEAFAYHEHEESLDRICSRAYERGMNFDLLSDNLPAEFVFPLYKIFTPSAGLGPCLKMLPRECGRYVLFNGPMVKFFWHPLLQRAENNPLAAKFATQTAYRGVAGYYLRKGLRDKQRQKSKMAERPCVT
jgi:glycosyltransferase involved in cell wall biosynthesis